MIPRWGAQLAHPVAEGGIAEAVCFAVGLLGQVRCLPGGDVVLPESGAVIDVVRCHGILLRCGEAGESLWQVVIKEQVSIRGRLRYALQCSRMNPMGRTSVRQADG